MEIPKQFDLLNVCKNNKGDRSIEEHERLISFVSSIQSVINNAYLSGYEEGLKQLMTNL